MSFDTDASGINHIIILGKTNSGKTTAGKIIEQVSDFTHIEASDVFQNILQDQNKKYSVDNIMNYLETTDGTGVAQEIVKEIRITGCSAVITGLRKPEGVRFMLSELPKIVVVTIVAPRSVRKSRIDENRSNSIDNSNLKFERKESIDECLGINQAIKEYSNIELQNTGDIGTFESKITELLSEL
ncbi:hypothetical protein [Haloferax sp. Atlit-6N]|uniref:hypothetical protein n=1 Tax=Haloferax sp. Atlit-6N TaxID=2077205 RepID=UPI0011C01CA7|nr:hypothetical protein [Haloferax sp. Atlit-6N]